MPASDSSSAIRALCPQCGLCCNGVLFADVRLEPTDDAESLKKSGLPVRRRGNCRDFAQPCHALHADGQCDIYEQRPAMCRRFECGVLKDVIAGRLGETAALQIIRRALKLASQVRALLEVSGNSETHRPLTRRYQSVMRQPIDLAAGDEAGDRRGELMMAVHQLMELAQKRFLRPDPAKDDAAAEF